MQINILPYDKTVHKEGLLACYQADFAEMYKALPQLKWFKDQEDETIEGVRNDTIGDHATAFVAVSKSVVVGAIFAFCGEVEETGYDASCCFMDFYTTLPILSREDTFRCVRLLFDRVRIHAGFKKCKVMMFNLFVDLADANEILLRLGFVSKGPAKKMYEGHVIPWRAWSHAVSKEFL